MNYEPQMLLKERIGPVLLITVNRPDKLNAIAPGLLLALGSALDAAASDDETRVLVLTGAGPKAFVAGNDVAALSALDAVAAYREMVAGHRTFRRLHEFSKPTIAMVNGYALGGGFELALACDFIVASTTARFGFPEIKLNTMPGWGGTQLAVKKMGIARAKEMVLTGRHYNADECLDFGFINRMATPDALRGETLEFARSLAAHHAIALEMAKLAVNQADQLPLAVGMEFEAMAYAFNFGTPHARAGIRQFLQRRYVRSNRDVDTQTPMPPAS